MKQVSSLRTYMERFLTFFTLCLLLMASPSWAHHTSTSSASASTSLSTLILKDAAAKPSSQAYFLFEASQLDESVGQIYTWLFGGEYAFSKKLSAGGYLPLTYIDHNFRSSPFGLGDLAVYLKYLFLDTSHWFAYANSEWSFPTGDENDGLGRGSVGQTVTGFFAYKLKKWLVFASTGVLFGYESNSDPQILGTLGVSSPKFFDEKVNINLSLFNTLFIDSDVFSQGSGKLFAQPQVNFFLDHSDKWILSLSGKVSIYDYLERKSGVFLSSTNNALLIDVLYSGSLSLNYSFK